MNCPRCNGELRIVSEQIGVDNNKLPVFHRFAYCDFCMIKKDIDVQSVAVKKSESEKTEHSLTDIKPTDDLQTMLAKQELKRMYNNPVSIKTSRTINILLFVTAIISFVIEAYLFGMIMTISFILHVMMHTNRIAKQDRLEHLAAGKKIVNVCPMCKSTNIKMKVVRTGSRTKHNVSRVSKNVNPLHPFTHTNVKRGNDYSSVSYGNQCHCKNCGHIFAYPEVHYI